MAMRPRSAAAFAFKCSLLFLSSAVFSWGLQAKLSLYKTPQSPTTVIVAKLLTERRSAQTMASLENAPRLHPSWETEKVVVAVQANLPFSFEFHQVEVSLCRSGGCDSQGPDLMQRPPPVFS
jgi:hypothetical protein